MTIDPRPATAYFAADAEESDEVARLRLIEAEWDPQTIRHLEAIGVGAGWHCLEVGAGAGSVVRWLSERVGPTGRVVAADINPRFLGGLREPNVEVRRCDITRDEIELGRYDLVHCRHLVIHMDDAADVLRRMTAALRPGGWLLVEEPDLGAVEAVDQAHPLAGPFDYAHRKQTEFASADGIFDSRFGKTLPVHMEGLGLIEVGNEGFVRVYRGGDPQSRMWIQTWQHTNDRMISEGALTESEVADMRRAYEDPTFIYRGAVTQSIWGRKPAL